MTLFLLILLLLLPFSFCSVQQGYNISEIDQVLCKKRKKNLKKTIHLLFLNF